jgi:dihydrofolate reductase
LTDGHVVLAGRYTHESIVARLGKPLPGRFTVVATRAVDVGGTDQVVFEPTIDAALSVARGIERFAGGAEVFVIGGAQIFAQTLTEVDTVYLTRVHSEPDGDTRMPAGWLTGFTLTDEQPGPVFSFRTYRRR